MKHHPEVLTLLLKRFKFNYRYEKHVKVRRRVQIPEYLQIPPNDKGQIYELYAYVEHFGELRNGHYTVTIKAQNDDFWYTFDDQRVFFSRYCQPFASNKSETNYKVYLLFYKKISTNSSNADDSATSISGCFMSDQQSRNDIEPKEGQKSKESAVRGKNTQNRGKNYSKMTGTDYDGSMSTDKPPEYRKVQDDKTNKTTGNKQVVSITAESPEVVDNHQKQQGDASSKLNESPPTGLSKEDSVVSKSDTIEQNRHAERQEQEKAVAEAECSRGKEKERIPLGKNQRGNNEIDKQEQDQELFDSKSETRHSVRDTIYHLMKKVGVEGFQKNTSKIAPEVKRLKMTDRNSTNVCGIQQRVRSNGQSKINGREVHVSGYLTSGLDQNQTHSHTVRAAVLNKPAECNKPSQKRENDFQYVEICGKFYENWGEIITGKKESYLILKGRCMASGEYFNQQNACHNPDCKINQLSHHIHFHADVLDEPCREASKLNTKAANLQTAGTSENHHCRSEVSQKTGPLSQPKQMIGPLCAVNQNQMTDNIQNSTANKTIEKGDANIQCNHLTIHSSDDINSSSFQTYSRTGSPLQQSLDAEGNDIAVLSSDLKSLTLDDSPNKDDSLEGPGNGTGNQQFTVSNYEKNTNPQSDMQIQIETEEPNEGSKRMCPGLFSQFYN